MIRKLINRDKNSAAAPEGKTIYAIGDIHGCAELLEQLIAKIDADAGGLEAAQLVFLGDYVDRGPDSKGVIDQLIGLRQRQPDAVFLKGNHEALLLDFLNDPEGMAHWLDWGGEETLVSYGLSDILRRSGENLAAEFAEALPPEHLSFLKALTLKHRAGDYVFVHAGLRPGISLDEQSEEDLLWIRKRFHNTPRDQRPSFTVVHGHQPVKKPLDKGWRIDVDTGACWSGKLTAVVLEGKARRFVST
jgi:diadenosine tetraphosphatase ApaH/serine/threonine PP2A family protein phosphatase